MIIMMHPTKANNTSLSYFVMFVWGLVLMEVGFGQNQTSEIKVGVVLDLQTKFSKICLTAIKMSLSDFYNDHPNYRIRLALHVRDSMEDTVQASAAALDLIKNEQVSAIIGPRNSMQAEFMIRLANKTQVPTITFSASSPLLTSIKSPYFVRTTIDDSSQVKPIAAIVKSFGWRSVIAIYMDNEFGKGIMPYLFGALEYVEVRRSVISSEASDDQILTELYKLMTKQTRVFVVHIASSLGLRVLEKAREIGMMEEGYVWLLTNEMMDMMNHNDLGRCLKKMQGVLGVRSHVPKSKALEDFRLRWKKKFEERNPLMVDDAYLNVFALRAYDSITALAMAVEKTSSKTLRYDNDNPSLNNKTDLGNLGVSRYGPSLIKALSDVRFKGLAGDFNLIDGQLESSKFEIINFIGNEERIIGFWTPSNGLMNANSNKTTSFRGEKFGPVIWPGTSTVVPKGWEIPRNGKKLRVGVPMRRGFLNFVDVKTDTINNITTVTGYAIDIFEAALKGLPYSVIPQYFPFDSTKENYKDLVEKRLNGEWDAIVGDVTITAKRSLYSDFTVPYTESGVSMLVPMKDNENNNTWVFLKPWTLELWVTTACVFIFIGFVVWLFEHRVNNDFRGPPHHQIGTSFWFSFSIMVFAHSEKVVSNLARFVVVVWCFVVLVLIQSYRANLTSFLTVQRFQPTVTSVKHLIRNGESVGYQDGSFVFDILKDLGFPESQLKSFRSPEECDELLSKGTSKGGIAAALDEVAYLKAILSKYCFKYAMVEPTFKTAGFGFVFPKNSPLTSDLSRAMLNVTQGDEMQLIENKWFKKQSNCPDAKTILSSNHLSLSSFWGLFLIAGLASFLALIVFVANFLYENMYMLYDDSENSVWRKLFRTFDERDIKSHMFKENAVHNVKSSITQCIPSPSTVQITPLPLCLSSIPNGEIFTLQPKQDGDEESDIQCELVNDRGM